MRNFSSTAIGILTVALMMSSLSLMSFLASPVSAASPDPPDPDPYEVIVRGTATAYNIDGALPLPHTVYHRGGYPPIMVAERIGSGAVVAGGISSTCRDEQWNSPFNPENHLDVLLDKAFQWMVPSAENVLWYQGHGVYNTTTQCSELISALENKGYTVTGDSTEPIDSDLLEPYDILVIPQLQLGDGDNGGNPTLLPDLDVQAIDNFVENAGGGLLIMEQSDYRSSEAHHFIFVQNKILDALGFSWRFQSDQVQDDTNNWEEMKSQPIVDVDPTTSIGSAYQSATGGTEIGLYNVCSLVRAGVPSPEYQFLLKVPLGAGFGEAGENVTFEAQIINVGTEGDTYSIAVEDERGWQPISVSEDEITLGSNENENIQVTVTIPENLTEKLSDWVTLKVSGVSGEENARLMAVSIVPQAAPPYPIAHPGEDYFWFSLPTQTVELPAVPIMTGIETGYGIDLTPREPWPILYAQGEYPRVGAAALVDNGRVITIGIANFRTLLVDYFTNLQLAAYDYAPLMARWLIDWGDPREHKFLFYSSGPELETWNDHTRLSGWLDMMDRDYGFELGIQEGGEITPELLENYDLFHLSDLEESLTDAETQAIAEWVKKGGGLLLCEQADYMGNGDSKWTNKVLEELGIPIRFQDDELYDDDNWVIDGAWFPQVYLLDPRGENPEFDVWFPEHGFTIQMTPHTVTVDDAQVLFALTITNTGSKGTTYGIEVEEITYPENLGWVVEVEPAEVGIAAGENAGIYLVVTVPDIEAGRERMDMYLKVTDNVQSFLTRSEDFAVLGEDGRTPPQAKFEVGQKLSHASWGEVTVKKLGYVGGGVWSYAVETADGELKLAAEGNLGVQPGVSTLIIVAAIVVIVVVVAAVYFILKRGKRKVGLGTAYG